MTNNSAFMFQSLSPDLILDGLESIGLYADSGLTALNSYENRVYQFIDEQRQRYVVKFYRPQRWSAEQIIEEHQFVSQLVDAEVPAVAPLTINGKTLHQHAGFLFALFPSMGGRQYETDNVDQLEWVGRFLGRIHQIGKQSLFEQRPTLGMTEYLDQPRAVLLNTTLLPKSLRENFTTALDQLISAVKAHWRSDCQLLRLHGDCHPGNILWRDGPLFVDFDDARNGPAIQDLWMLLNGTEQEQRIQLDILLEAYSEFAHIDMRELALIEPLRAMRMIHYLAWVVYRWQDPAFPTSFPWMVDQSFWSQQIVLFIEQTKRVQAEPLQLAPMY